MSLLPQLGRSVGGALQRFPTAGRVATTAGRVATTVGRNAGTIATVGAAGAVLFDQFGNPVRRKRRRSKGITGSELKAFKRVTGVLNTYCKTPPPTKRRSASRSKSCR